MDEFHAASNSSATKKPEIAHIASEDHDFIQREPPMRYQPLQEPVHEAPPLFVTPLSKLGDKPAQVDCPHCEKVVQTEIHRSASSDTGMTECLICLVCCPLLLCYRPDEDTSHHCSVCKTRLTHRPHGGTVVVVAATKAEPHQVASKYQQKA